MNSVLIKYWPVLMIFLLSIITIWPLFLPGYFSHHDDLQVMRIYEMRRCLLDLQIPCRWVPDMGYGNGFPLFNYYPPAPYYLGALLSFVTGYLISAKVLFLLPLVLGGVGMYLLGRELSDRWGGLLAGGLYLFAPYRALDSYVRGAVAESFALAVAPFLFYFAIQLIKCCTKWNLVLFSVSLLILLTSHNVMTLFFFPLLLLWITFFIVVERRWKSIKRVLFGLLLGIGLAAFFIWPAASETQLVQTETLTRFDLDFRVHYVTFSQLFLDREWGYGASRLGPEDTISFQIGWPHWWVVVGSAVVFSYGWYHRRIANGLSLGLYLIIMVIFGVSVLMTHNKSASIWESVGILRFTQFPWRFLSLAIFSLSLIGALTTPYWGRFKIFLTLVLIFLAVVLNYNFFKPEETYLLTDSEKVSGNLWEEQQRAGILDYLPKTAVEPREKAPDLPLVKQGEAVVSSFHNRSNDWDLVIDVLSPTIIEIPVFDFPLWSVYEEGKILTHTNQNHLGRIEFKLDPGRHYITGRLENTQVRSLANLVTLVSIVVLGLFISYEKARKIIL